MALSAPHLTVPEQARAHLELRRRRLHLVANRIPDIPYVRSRLYPKQEAAIFSPSRYVVIEASTKSGKTYGCLAWELDQALSGAENRNYWWVAPVYVQARVAFDRLRDALPRGTYISHLGDLTLRLLANRSTIWFKSGEKPDNLFGEDVWAAVIDEATRLREEAWHAIRTTLTATRGPLRIIGNVKGRRNWAYQLARKAEAGEPDMHYARLTAHDAIEAGVLDEAEVEDARQKLPDSVFRELYLAEPSDDAGNPFGLSAIKAQTLEDGMPDSSPVAWGWDLAKSVDWTVGVALDSEGRVCRLVRFQAPWEETINRVVHESGRTPGLVDSTGVGDPIFENIQRRHSTRLEDFKFTSGSKQQLMEGLAVAIQQGRVWFPPGPLVSELEAFEYEYSRTGVRYSAPEGMHDDCVVGLALAVRCKEMARHSHLQISLHRSSRSRPPDYERLLQSLKGHR